jgi:RimJ/RimL family protein N-acetyltransferase
MAINHHALKACVWSGNFLNNRPNSKGRFSFQKISQEIKVDLFKEKGRDMMTKLNFEKPILIDLPLPIETERLIIREPRAGDGQALYEAKMETWDSLHKWMPWAKEKNSVEDDEIVVREAYAKFIRREDLMMFAFEKVSGVFVGGTGLHRFDWDTRVIEIGYWYRQSAQGKGYATESTKALIRYAFDVLQANKVVICYADGNENSKRVIEKAGFEFEYTQRKEKILPSGELVDHHWFGLFNADHLHDFNVKWGMTP